MQSRAPRRVWFNKTFSSVYNVIRLLRRPEAPGPFHVLCSHPNAEFVAFQVSDEREVEPVGLGAEEYVAWCVDFCVRHQVEVFVPGVMKVAIVRARSAFESLGVRLLLAATPERMDFFEDKARFYAELDPAVALPPRFFKVNTAEEFTAACAALGENGGRACFKPSSSTGGLGFRILDDERSDLRNLFGGDSLRLSTGLATQILARESPFRDLLVMEYLEGAEYSVDCLAAQGRLLRAIPRRKAVRLGGVQMLEDHAELIEICRRLAAAYDLEGIFNVQLRYRGEVAKVLEINARMSGGIYFACLSGVNLPAWAIALVAGDAREDDIPWPRLGLPVHQQFHEFVFEALPAGEPLAAR